MLKSTARLSAIRTALMAVTLAAVSFACTDPGASANVDHTRTRNEPTADDLDGDGIPNSEDADIDDDGIPNASDLDMDGDRIPNEIDDDIDGDGVANDQDDTPFGTNPDGVDGPWADPDGDGLPNLTDNDDDNDGIPDGVIGENDCDGDGIPEDENNDCDGFCIDVEAGLVACDDGGLPGGGAPDRDGDGIPDALDPDDDNDDTPDAEDENPNGADPCVGLEGPPPPGCFDDPEPEPTCDTTTFDPVDPIPPRIMLVVDRSGSMNEGANGFGGSKWDATIDALDEVNHQLEGRVELGLILYPAGATVNDQCVAGGLEEQVRLNNADNISDALFSTAPGGGTPTAPTLLVARNQLTALGAQGGQRAVIIATDGGPNCNESLNGDTCRCVSTPDQCQSFSANCLDDVNAIAAASQLNQSGFPVFVLGIDGALAFGDVLTRLAQAGGTNNFFGINSADSLAQTIEDIATRVGSCRFDLPGAPNADRLTVTVDGAPIGRDTNRQNGWDLIDVDTVELFGAACTTASQATQNVSIQTCF